MSDGPLLEGFCWCSQQDSNPQPDVLEAFALPLSYRSFSDCLLPDKPETPGKQSCLSLICGLCRTGFYAFAPPILVLHSFRECVPSLASSAGTSGSFPFKNPAVSALPTLSVSVSHTGCTACLVEELNLSDPG